MERQILQLTNEFLLKRSKIKEKMNLINSSLKNILSFNQNENILSFNQNENTLFNQNEKVDLIINHNEKEMRN